MTVPKRDIIYGSDVILCALRSRVIGLVSATELDLEKNNEKRLKL